MEIKYPRTHKDQYEECVLLNPVRNPMNILSVMKIRSGELAPGNTVYNQEQVIDCLKST